MKCPVTVPDARQVPAGSSTASRERHTSGESLPGGSECTTRSTEPSRSRNITSIGKRIPNVWTCRHFWKHIAPPLASDSRPSSPRRRSLWVEGDSTSAARVCPLVLSTRSKVPCQVRSRMTFAGTPAAMVYSGTSFVTTAPAPIIAPSPIVTPLRTTTPAPSQQSEPMLTGA